MKGSSCVATAEQHRAVVADVEVGGDVPFGLRLATAERDQHGEGEQLAGLQRRCRCACSGRRSSWPRAGAGCAARRRAPRRRAPSTTSAPMISFSTASPFCARVSGVVVDCPSSGSCDAALGEDVVRRVDEVEGLGHADVGHRLVDDLLDLDRRDPHGERRAEHDPVLAQGLAGDQRRELHHAGASSRRGLPCSSTSSKAKLSKLSMSSGSVTFRVETWPGNSSSWVLRARSLMAMSESSPRARAT